MIKTVQIAIKALDTRFRMPEFAHPGEDACFDVFPLEHFEIPPHASWIVKLGFATAFPIGWEALIRTRSSQGFKNDIRLHPGTIDSGFRAEWSVKVYNNSDRFYSVDPKIAVAQVAVREVPIVYFLSVEELPESHRGMGGSGSSDKV